MPNIKIGTLILHQGVIHRVTDLFNTTDGKMITLTDHIGPATGYLKHVLKLKIQILSIKHYHSLL